MLHRRKFLGAVTIGAGFTVVPMWLQRAFGPQPGACPEAAPACEPAPQPSVAMPACGPLDQPFRPLLVLVIPADKSVQWQRGSAFGEFLNHGSDAQLAALACFEVTCQRIDQLAAPLRQQVGEEPLMLVIDASAERPVLALNAKLDPDPEYDRGSRWRGDPEAGDHERSREAAIDARITILADLITRAADGPRLAAQACRERQGLPKPDLQRLAELPQSLGELGPRDLERCPALALLAARSGDARQRDHLTTLLAASVRGRLLDRPIPGAPWARGYGCGVTVEGDPRESRVSCGMGNVPERSSRFLMFYADRHGL